MSSEMAFPDLHSIDDEDVIDVIDPQPGRRFYIVGMGGTAPIRADELYKAVVYWNTRERKEKIGGYDWRGE